MTCKEYRRGKESSPALPQYTPFLAQDSTIATGERGCLIFKSALGKARGAAVELSDQESLVLWVGVDITTPRDVIWDVRDS